MQTVLSTAIKTTRVLAALIGVLIIYAGLAQLFVQGHMFARNIDGKIQITDFVNHYNAGLLSKECLSGNKLNIYDPQVQEASEDKVIAPIKPEHPFYLQYPPYFFALMLPLSVTNISLAYCAWTAASLAGLMFCLFYILRQTSFEKSNRTLLVLCALLAYPTWLSFGMGQTSLLNFTAIVVSIMLLQKERPLTAGLVASLVAVKVQYAPAIFVLGLLLGRWRFVLGFAAGVALLVLFALAVLGVDNLIAWPQALFMGETSKDVSGVSPMRMQCLRGYLSVLTHDKLPKEVAAVAGIGFACGLAGIAWLWRRYKIDLENTTQELRFKLSMALTFLLMMLTSLHTHVYDYVMMTLPAIWIWDISRADRSPQAHIMRALIASYPVLSWVSAKTREQQELVFVMFDALWALLLFMFAMQLYRRAQKN